MTDKSRQAYAISMANGYQPALAIEIFYHRGSNPLPSHKAVTWYKPGWYWRDTETGQWGGPFNSADAADEDYFTV